MLHGGGRMGISKHRKSGRVPRNKTVALDVERRMNQPKIQHKQKRYESVHEAFHDKGKP